jgi:hypothetical protein
MEGEPGKWMRILSATESKAGHFRRQEGMPELVRISAQDSGARDVEHVASKVSQLEHDHRSGTLAYGES